MMNHAHSVDDWRPGFAKRAQNFDEVRAQAIAWRWSAGETVARVLAAVLKGTPTLSTPQRMTLMLYVEHLSQDDLEQDIASVWPSTSLVAECLGCSQSQARANRRALEAAGFMVRDYDPYNRPAGVEAYDLRSLMARLGELEGVYDDMRDRRAARRAAYGQSGVFPTKYGAQAPEYRRQEQSQKNFSSSVREKDAAMPRHSPNSRPATRTGNGEVHDSSGKRSQRRQQSANCSPGGASVFGNASPDPSVYAEMVRQELRSAAKACPRLAALVTPTLLADPLGATPEDAARVAAAAAELLPQPERNNDQTAMWGWRKHGARVLVMLAIAVEDPTVRSPCAYFGKLAVQDRGAADLRLNLARILKAKGEVQPPEAPSAPTDQLDPDVQARRLAEDLVAPPGTEDPKWQAIAFELRRILREGKFGSWFGRVGFGGVVDGVLTLTTPNGHVAERIRGEFIPQIVAAAETADVFVERVIVTLRRS